MPRYNIFGKRKLGALPAWMKRGSYRPKEKLLGTVLQDNLEKAKRRAKVLFPDHTITRLTVRKAK